MERIGVRELRQPASRYLDRVKAGETVEVTERGQPVALLVPPDPATNARERLVASGRLIPASGPLDFPGARQRPPGPQTPARSWTRCVRTGCDLPRHLGSAEAAV